jgi:hypothetical protein
VKPLVTVILISGLVVGFAVTQFSDYSAYNALASGLGLINRTYDLGLLWAAILTGVVLVLPFDRGIRAHLIALWLLRCFVTLGFMLGYEFHYKSLDAFLYYMIGSGNYISEDMAEGSNTVIFLIAGLIKYVPALNSYHALKVVWSFLGFIGGYFFYRSYEIATGQVNRRVLWIMCAFPSILFWSSILGKDPIVFFGLSLACYGVMRSFDKLDFWSWLNFGLGFYIISTIRLWTACTVLFAVAIVYLNMESRKTWPMLILRISVWGALIWGSNQMIQNLQVASQSDLVDRVNVMSRGWSMGGSGQEVPELKRFDQMAAFLPKGMFAALFRPLPGEVNNLFGAVAGFENLGLLLIALGSIGLMRSGYAADKRLQFLLLTILFWSFIYAFISYQNLGSAVRFKIQILPFMLLAMFMIRRKYIDNKPKN